MTTNDGPSSETEYDNILGKLDALLRKHQDKPQLSPWMDNSAEPIPNIIPGGIPSGTASSASNDIPTLTEAVMFTPGMLSSQSDVTSMLAQIVDSSLKDAGAPLNANARAALVQALESRLFGL